MPTETKHATQNASQYADLLGTLERHVFLPPANVTPAFLFAEFAHWPSLPVNLGIRRDGIRVLEMGPSTAALEDRGFWAKWGFLNRTDSALSSW